MIRIPAIGQCSRPYERLGFTAADGPEAFTTARTTLVSGRLLTGYGPHYSKAAAFTA